MTEEPGRDADHQLVESADDQLVEGADDQLVDGPDDGFPAGGPSTHSGSIADAADELSEFDLADAADQDLAASGALDTDVEDELTRTRTELAERTLDLQRLQAEYLNYKRRVERDRELIRQNAVYTALAPITEVLDTIDRAREHGPLEGGFKAVADQLERVVASVGLTKFGAVGDPFDPTIHEALSHVGEDPEVEVTTCKVIAKAGYRIGDRVVRAAQVLVVDPVSLPDKQEEPVGPDEPDEPLQ